MKNRDIIIVGQQPWDVEIGSNCKNIAEEFSRHNRVLYVNAPLDRRSWLQNKNDPKIKKRVRVILGKENGLVQVHKNLWTLYPDCMAESINWINVDFIFNFFNKSNNIRFAHSIKKAASHLQFDNFILFNDNEFFKCFYLKELLNPLISIYYCRDFMLATDYWKKHGRKLEPLLIAKSDLCVANSTYLAEYCNMYNPNSYYVGQGCDIAAFQGKAVTIPGSLEFVSSPVIGYVGALLGTRLDIDLLTHIAQKHPDWSLVLVGPEDEHFKNSRLHSFRNVYFTGAIPSTELPDYISAFDVCINPQIINQLTVGNYPRKIDEYLAMGKPTVAIKTLAMEIFADYVYLAKDKEEFVVKIETALKEDTKAQHHKRKTFAATHSWEKNVEEIYKAITLKIRFAEEGVLQ